MNLFNYGFLWAKFVFNFNLSVSTHILKHPVCFCFNLNLNLNWTSYIEMETRILDKRWSNLMWRDNAVLGFFLRLLGDPNGAELSHSETWVQSALSRGKKPGWLGGQETFFDRRKLLRQMFSNLKINLALSFRLESKIFESLLPRLLFRLAAHTHTLM